MRFCRRQRTSSILEAAHQRMAGLKSISPAPDFRSTLTLTAYATEISNFSTKLNSYDQMMSALDDLQNQVDAAEARLRETNKRMLSAVEAHYGPDSSEYELAGGTRVSDRKRPTKKTPPNPAS